MTLAHPDDDLDDSDFYADPPDRGPGVGRRLWNWLRRLSPLIVWLSVLASAGFAFVRIFGLERNWVGYTLIAFTPYLAIGTLVPLALAAAYRRKRAALVALVASFALGCVFLPRLVGHRDPVRGPTLHVMSINTEIGSADPRHIVRLIQDHDVDVLAVQGLTSQSEVDLRAAGLSLLLPYSEQDPAADGAGSGLFSRFPLTGTGSMTLPGSFRQAYGIVQVPGAQPVFVVSVHPVPPDRPSTVHYWYSDLTHEPAADPKGQMRLLIGDFNSTLDHAILRHLIDTGYHDAAAQLGDGFVSTWPYEGFPLPRITLDHALVDPRIGVSSLQAYRVPGTDHRSIIVTLTVPRD